MNSNRPKGWYRAALAQSISVCLTILHPFTAEAADLPFIEVADPALSAYRGQVYSAAWGDYDRDGRPDLYLCTLFNAPAAFFRNTGSGFERVIRPPTGVGVASRAGAVWLDADNDGDLDLFVATTANQNDVLFWNLGDGSFSKAENDPAATSGGLGQSAVAGDFDGDGWVDLFVPNGGGFRPEENFLFSNPSGAGFTRLTAGEVATERRYSSGATAIDYDNDGDLDLLVCNIWEPNSLFQNLGRGRFERVTHGAIVEETETTGANSAAWGDVDNDGDFDLLVTHGSPVHQFYRNEGSGRWTKIVDTPVRSRPDSGQGAVWADFDNDGWLDLLIARRDGRHLLLHGTGGGGLETVTDNPVTLDPRGANGVAVADMDDDGDVDVLLLNWSENGAPALYRNEARGHAWLRVRLDGRQSNRAGIGAKVRVRARIGGRDLWQLRQIGGEDAQGSQELTAHFGMGDATQAEVVRIEWPSGAVTDLAGVTSRQTLVIQETTAALEVIPSNGRFTNQVQVAVSSGLPHAALRFTTDGTEPTLASARYEGPLTFQQATSLRVRAFVNGFPVTEIATNEFARVYAFDDEGIPPAWREHYFGPSYATDPRAAAEADPDHDRSNNRQEYHGQTDPLDPLSGIGIAVRPVPELRFPSVPSHRYRVLVRGALDSSASIVIAELTADGPVTTFLDPHPEALFSPAFYSVESVP